jgi:hypothetical protein
VSWDTVSRGHRPLSWGYPGILRMPPVSHDANLRFQMATSLSSPTIRDKLLVHPPPPRSESDPHSPLPPPPSSQNNGHNKHKKDGKLRFCGQVPQMLVSRFQTAEL